MNENLMLNSFSFNKPKTNQSDLSFLKESSRSHQHPASTKCGAGQKSRAIWKKNHLALAAAVAIWMQVKRSGQITGCYNLADDCYNFEK